MQKIYVIRHAETQVVPNIPSTEWELSHEATESIRDMLKNIKLDVVQCIYHSPLVKAEATARIISEIYGVETKANGCLRWNNYVHQESS